MNLLKMNLLKRKYKYLLIKKPDFYKNKLIDSVLGHYYDTFSQTLDTGDFVPPEYNEKIRCYIFKNLKKKFKEINKINRLHHKKCELESLKKLELLDKEKTLKLKNERLEFKEKRKQDRLEKIKEMKEKKEKQ